VHQLEAAPVEDARVSGHEVGRAGQVDRHGEEPASGWLPAVHRSISVRYLPRRLSVSGVRSIKSMIEAQ